MIRIIYQRWSNGNTDCRERLLQIIDHALDQLPAGQRRQRLDRGIVRRSRSRWSGGRFICTQAVTPTLQVDADRSPLLIEPAPGIDIQGRAIATFRGTAPLVAS